MRDREREANYMKKNNKGKDNVNELSVRGLAGRTRAPRLMEHARGIAWLLLWARRPPSAGPALKKLTVTPLASSIYYVTLLPWFNVAQSRLLRNSPAHALKILYFAMPFSAGNQGILSRHFFRSFCFFRFFIARDSMLHIHERAIFLLYFVLFAWYYCTYTQLF